MKRVIIVLALALACASLIAAQEAETPSQPGSAPVEAPATNPEKPDVQKPESRYEYEPVRKGDQFIRLGLGIGKSLFNIAPGGLVTETNLNLGGSGSIGYSQFINGNVAIGAEIDFAFCPTLGSNIFFYLPLMARVTYQFDYGRMRFPISLGLGIAFQSYDEQNYFGVVGSPEIAAFFQYSPSWSFGATCSMSFVPQFYENTEDNRTGVFLNAGLAVRYHF
ncbi:MAG TPA: hypothetical protein PLU93_04525 [Treponemataceae bacterium]|jgi:hypothetical protein|nr:hypothetical protein [Treponemataceae bacterium]